MSWTRKPLAQVAELCLGKMLDAKKNRGEPMPYLANVNVRWGAFELDDLREMRFEPHELDRYGLRYGDIVMCEGGEPGRCAIWKDEVPGMMIQKAIHRIRPNEELDYRFLYYLFLHKGRNDGFSGLFTGATIKHLPGQNLAKVEVAYPAKPEQKRIADLLSAYDDLIENNHRRIKLLEESARLLYREWFVHLRYPGHEHVKIVEGVPEGWNRLTLRDSCEYVEDGDWIESKDQGGDDYRLLQVSNIGVDSFVETGNFRYVTGETFRRLNCREVCPGDILVSRMPDPIGRAWLATEMPWRMITAVDVAIVRPDRSRVTPYFLLQHLNSRASLELATQHATGTTRLRISRRSLCALPVVVPPITLQSEFDEAIAGNYELRSNLQKQVGKLIQARDLLLPRLMSGEVVV
ncbi:restriction endonuclease subunit S [Lysobacter solisilvae (ex Woo and Kim 2022)]|uniref:Restriction endonuclease subunit S n=1 Tax=Agrilutibacter terrestris TaxID=2865112 RepID=A0A7H0G011_9GAMM|nr:restriction endonuclease subunit S [Lysobacter terrestris]QNP41627.1 restriction endonuclease subunit S [Lysobacter terrestris]